MNIPSQTVPCGTCGGTGSTGGGQKCPTCGGSGTVKQ